MISINRYPLDIPFEVLVESVAEAEATDSTKTKTESHSQALLQPLQRCLYFSVQGSVHCLWFQYFPVKIMICPLMYLFKTKDGKQRQYGNQGILLNFAGRGSGQTSFDCP